MIDFDELIDGHLKRSLLGIVLVVLMSGSAFAMCAPTNIENVEPDIDCLSIKETTYCSGTIKINNSCNNSFEILKEIETTYNGSQIIHGEGEVILSSVRSGEEGEYTPEGGDFKLIGEINGKRVEVVGARESGGCGSLLRAISILTAIISLLMIALGLRDIKISKRNRGKLLIALGVILIVISLGLYLNSFEIIC